MLRGPILRGQRAIIWSPKPKPLRQALSAFCSLWKLANEWRPTSLSVLEA